MVRAFWQGWLPDVLGARYQQRPVAASFLCGQRRYFVGRERLQQWICSGTSGTSSTSPGPSRSLDSDAWLAGAQHLSAHAGAVEKPGHERVVYVAHSHQPDGRVQPVVLHPLRGPDLLQRAQRQHMGAGLCRLLWPGRGNPGERLPPGDRESTTPKVPHAQHCGRRLDHLWRLCRGQQHDSCAGALS